MNFSTTTEDGAYCRRSRHGAIILDSVIIIFISSSSSLSEDFDWYVDDCLSNDWYRNDWYSHEWYSNG